MSKATCNCCKRNARQRLSVGSCGNLLSSWPKGSLYLGDGISLGMLQLGHLNVLGRVLAKRLLPTRLETRTKESNIYASLRVEKPIGVMKVNKGAKRKRCSIDRP